MAGSDEQPTFADALANVLRDQSVSQKELARRIAGPDATDRQIENKRTGILRWLAEKHEPETASARQVEEALAVVPGTLTNLLDRRPRGRRPAAGLAELRDRVAALEAATGETGDDAAPLGAHPSTFGARLQELEAQAVERTREAQDLAQLIAGLVVRVEHLEGGASRKRGSP